MGSISRRLSAALLALCLAFGVGLSAYAADADSDDSSAAQRKALAYDSVPVYIDGLLLGKAYEKNGELFMDPKILCSFLDIDFDYQADSESMSFTVPGAELYGDSSLEYMTANGRYMYSPQGWLFENGKLYLPLDIIGRFFTVEVSRQDDIANISTNGMKIISGGEDYYELNYPSEDLFWLTSIIYAEANGQPLAGKIGVGNVVLNRVAAKEFPNTVFDVVFDIGGVVQFEPVSNGGIYQTPDDSARLAACLVLEGFNTVGDSLYFVNPKMGSFWFDSSLEFVKAIADHNFYR